MRSSPTPTEETLHCLPRERLVKYGAHSLADSELLAILLNSGGKHNSVHALSKKLLNKYSGLQGLFNASIEQLCEIKDIGSAKATLIKAICELSLRMTLHVADSAEVTNPTVVYKLVKPLIYKKQREYLIVLSLNSRNKLIATDVISIGILNQTLIHSREVYKAAILRSAASIILVHNHPSNDATPSEDDLQITKSVFHSGVILGIKLLDHLVVADSSYTSIKSLNNLNYLFKEDFNEI